LQPISFLSNRQQTSLNLESGYLSNKKKGWKILILQQEAACRKRYTFVIFSRSHNFLIQRFLVFFYPPLMESLKLALYVQSIET